MTLQDFEFAVLTAIGICILICLVKKNKNDSEMIENYKANSRFWENVNLVELEKQVSIPAKDDNRSTTVK